VVASNLELDSFHNITSLSKHNGRKQKHGQVIILSPLYAPLV
jgi:hypothetical protein